MPVQFTTRMTKLCFSWNSIGSQAVQVRGTRLPWNPSSQGTALREAPRAELCSPETQSFQTDVELTSREKSRKTPVPHSAETQAQLPQTKLGRDWPQRTPAPGHTATCHRSSASTSKTHRVDCAMDASSPRPGCFFTASWQVKGFTFWFLD